MSSEIHDLLQRCADRFQVAAGQAPNLGRVAPSVFHQLIASYLPGTREFFPNEDFCWNGIRVRRDPSLAPGMAYFTYEEPHALES